MAVLAAVDVSIADDVRVIVRNREVSVNPIVLVDVIVDRVVVCTQNHRAIAQLSDPFINVLEILSHQIPSSSVAPTDERYDRRLV